jgi:hypothetical protein
VLHCVALVSSSCCCVLCSSAAFIYEIQLYLSQAAAHSCHIWHSN